MALLGNSQTLISSLGIVPLCETGGGLWRSVFAGVCTAPAHAASSVPLSLIGFSLKGAHSFLNHDKALLQWSAVSLG